jgi:hypothetical protein
MTEAASMANVAMANVAFFYYIRSTIWLRVVLLIGEDNG